MLNANWNTKKKNTSVHSKLLEDLSTSIVAGYLFYKFNTSLQIKTKIYKGPLNALSLVLFLLKDKHMVIEELLKFLICEIDAKLFKTVELRIGKTIQKRVELTKQITKQKNCIPVKVKQNHSKHPVTFHLLQWFYYWGFLFMKSYIKYLENTKRFKGMVTTGIL